MDSVHFKYVRSGIMIILAGLVCLRGISAQEPAVFNQHQHNRMVYNPAFVGDRSIPGFSIFSRQQWLGWEGSPSSNTLMAHTRMKNKNVGLGVSLAYDRMGPVQHTGLTGAYSYSLTLNEDQRIILGLQGELRVQQIRLSHLQLIDQGDPSFAEDPGMKLQPNVGLGINYILGNYSVHISVPRVLNSDLSPFEGETSKWSTTTRILYLGATSNYQISENLKVAPSALIALSRGDPFFMELSGLIHYRNRFGVGTFYRLNKTVGALIRYNHMEKIMFGYSYDVSFKLTGNNAGTHEIYLGYNFPFNRTKTISPSQF